ncbi:methyltransferase domain-containing protein [Streptomyces sp. TRM43335]|uniref:Methyltransferase domain-containing protein n=1 Tax=Streptomyces taklimakanensis TaxID=2569853 RepID=A0A6G2B909_9ACTN|nr:class I SAM-dependent methyltransferase [Streptomyces taklimakanensis]MTE18559.1 methyltransferase domain-containing protein [Streptomyces taklimakanensis]
MTRAAAYDEITNRHGAVLPDDLPPRPGADGPLDLGALLRDLLGEGTGPCLDIGCGTGAHASVVRALGWTPLGVALSAGPPHGTRGRLSVARADAGRLPVRNSSVPAVVAVPALTDVPDRPAVLREVARVLRPGGVFVHIGVHPCFRDALVDRPGAARPPLPELLHTFLDAGLALERFAEEGSPTPTVLAVGARR